MNIISIIFQVEQFATVLEKPKYTSDTSPVIPFAIIYRAIVPFFARFELVFKPILSTCVTNVA